MINEKYIKTLELDKILQELSQYGSCEAAVERILQIKPSSNQRIVIDELEKTNAAYNMSSYNGTPHFARLHSPAEPLKVAKLGGLMSMRQLLNVSEVLRQVKSLTQWYGSCKTKEPALADVFELLLPNNALMERITSVIISEDEIDDYASEELALIRKKIRSNTAKVRESLDKLIRSSSMQKALQESIVTMRDGRYVIPVKAEYKGSVNGLVHDTSSSGATLFVEPMVVVETNNEIRVLQSREKAEIERILYELSALCGDSADNIIDNFETIITLNVYFAKASYAAKLRATKPQIVTNGHIQLCKARHPLIDSKKVVAIDVELGEGYKTLLVTGPNTGGKTVTLKTIGLLTLMTMCGMLIPVTDGSIISIFDKVLVDIGDEQSIEQSLSTFSSHMTNIVSILNTVDNHSLVLLDELGSGTDPVEGASLAMAILEKLKEKGAVVAATTHYSELKVYALNTEGVLNACCEFDIKTLMPTYRLLVGVPGRSNAFEISRRLGLSDDILETAKGLVASDKKSFEDVIEQLEESRLEFITQKNQLEQREREVSALKERLTQDNSKVLKERDQIIEKAQYEAKKLVEDIRLQSELLLSELDEIRKQKNKEDFASMAINARSALRSKVNRMYDTANPVSERDNQGEYTLPRPLVKGDTVLIYDIDKKGTVLEVSDRTVMVQAGIMKTRVSIDNLRLVDEPKVKVAGGVKRTIQSKKDAKVTIELDLRGKTVEEAIMELDMYVNKCILLNTPIFTIIHGKGTGALRKAVHQFLKNHKQVKTYRLGVYGEGESGVTIVNL